MGPGREELVREERVEGGRSDQATKKLSGKNDGGRGVDMRAGDGRSRLKVEEKEAAK